MTDRLSLVLALIVVAAIVLDGAANGFSASLFLARKFADLLEWIAFWR